MLELLQAIEPHGLEVLGEGSEGGAVGAVEVLATAFCHQDEVRVAQDAKMLRYCSKCDVSIGGDIAGSSLLIPYELEDLLAAWFSEDGEGVDHDIILVYTKI